ncbi:ComEC/Rec2 family competence protein [Aurantiacibacter flavus]|uniref:ComEC/Rec2 family competence protein n=1 Tax=Aurantiacibacter flavus TaxID=3145232 RepID=A0ABV0CWT4_9SPHN
MATHSPPPVPMGDDTGNAATQQPHWLSRVSLSSLGDGAEEFLADAGFDRGPWLAVAFAGGVAAWFVLPGPAAWIGAMAAGAMAALGALAAWRGREDRARLLLAIVTVGLLIAAGVATGWARSALVGTEAFERPLSADLEGRVLERIEQPADERVRLVLAIRDPDTGEPAKVRINVPLADDDPAYREGALIAFTARLMPPASPMLPGGYDFARSAWFTGYAATGSVQGDIALVEPATGGEGWLAEVQRRLSAHVRGQLGGASGTIAAAFASGDRGAIGAADEIAMRDAGLTHLLSISGLHVSAVIAGTYLLAIRLLALWPWLTLRMRLPVGAAALAALAGAGYTLLTGAQVPTVRSCVAALLVLGALALGRAPLSLRMVAVAAVIVLLLWPESIVGPSFQMSFAAVIAIVALHNCGWAKAFLAPREERRLTRLGRQTAMLLITGFVIELALMPIVLFHFHRAGVYGALANVIAIPLVTFVSMPLIALALVLDLIGAGAPVWWLAGQSLDLMLAIAHFTAAQPGAVKLFPHPGAWTMALFVAGGLWLALWQGRARAWGLAPVALATVLMLATRVPDVLVSSDGRHVGITTADRRLIMLRDTDSAYTRDNLMQLAGVEAEPVALADWPGARCSPEFCSVTLERAGRAWHLLLARSDLIVEERALAAACQRADIVVADRWLPRSCQPRWLKADRRMLAASGGLAILLDPPEVTTVAQGQGEHGWWRGEAED